MTDKNGIRLRPESREWLQKHSDSLLPIEILPCDSGDWKVGFNCNGTWYTLSYFPQSRKDDAIYAVENIMGCRVGRV